MATRYCGSIKVNCKLVSSPHAPHGEQYKCTISHKGKRLGTTYVGIPVYIDKGIDSPEAYDEAASAAIAFAQDEEERGERDWGSLGDYCDYTDSDRYVRRAEKYTAKDLKAGGR